MRNYVLGACLGLVLIACGAAQESAGDAAAGETTTTGNVATTGSVSSDTSVPLDSSTVPEDPATRGVPDSIVEQAVADLAAHLNVPEGSIEVMEAKPVTWPDAAVGCPEPGKLYAQVLVDGARIVLGHAERVYLYHSGSDGEPFLCPSEEKGGGYDFVPPPGFDE